MLGFGRDRPLQLVIPAREKHGVFFEIGNARKLQPLLVKAAERARAGRRRQQPLGLRRKTGVAVELAALRGCKQCRIGC